ncbi:beta strand repeat-containing protein [Yoonia sp. 208BN28-4]|uniref:beta strand repeat-containing protein n=1 Tax=Yoonia sp. 208BN28-4 TaxID=3126505 RepID=UPI0030959292
MATIIGTSTVQFDANTSNTTYFLPKDNLLNVVGDAIAASATGLERSFHIAGTIFASGADGIDLQDSTDDGIVVEETGLINGSSSAIEITGSGFSLSNAGTLSAKATSGATVLVDGNNAMIENTGRITSQSNNAISVSGETIQVINGGTILADEYGVSLFGSNTVSNSGFITGGVAGALSNGSNSVYNNTGMITGVDFGLLVQGDTGTINNSGNISASGVNSIGVSLTTMANDVIVNSGQISGVQGGLAASGQGVSVTNSGSISSTGGDAIVLSGSGQVTNTAQGTVNARDAAIDVAGLASQAVNAGSLTSEDVGIIMQGDAVTVDNSGSIVAENIGIATIGVNATVTNTGSISTSSFEGVGVFLQRADSIFINEGTVIGGNTAVVMEGDNSQLINEAGGVISGKLRGNDRDAVRVESNAGDVNEITNLGTIEGTIFSTFFGFFEEQDDQPGVGVEILTNSGLIDGDVYLHGGDDIYDGSLGTLTVFSEIHLGSGDDELLGGEGRERVYDGGGDDLVETGGGNDSIRAGTGQNDYDGGEGNDYLSYYDFATAIRIDLLTNSTAGGAAGNAAGNDTLVNIENLGGTDGGGDTLIGDNDANALYGWGGNDNLYGRSGNDKLVGGDGEDFFDGGAGNDRLFGEGGADTFQFDAGEDHDYVMDFENNIDTVEFDGFSYLTNAASALTYATQEGNDVVFDFGADGMLTVFGTTTGQLANDIDIV